MKTVFKLSLFFFGFVLFCNSLFSQELFTSLPAVELSDDAEQLINDFEVLESSRCENLVEPSNIPNISEEDIKFIEKVKYTLNIFKYTENKNIKKDLGLFKIRNEFNEAVILAQGNSSDLLLEENLINNIITALRAIRRFNSEFDQIQIKSKFYLDLLILKFEKDLLGEELPESLRILNDAFYGEVRFYKESPRTVLIFFKKPIDIFRLKEIYSEAEIEGVSCVKLVKWNRYCDPLGNNSNVTLQIKSDTCWEFTLRLDTCIYYITYNPYEESITGKRFENYKLNDDLVSVLTDHLLDKMKTIKKAT